jgi:hypothetical protein
MIRGKSGGRKLEYRSWTKWEKEIRATRGV